MSALAFARAGAGDEDDVNRRVLIGMGDARAQRPVLLGDGVVAGERPPRGRDSGGTPARCERPWRRRSAAPRPERDRPPRRPTLGRGRWDGSTGSGMRSQAHARRPPVRPFRGWSACGSYVSPLARCQAGMCLMLPRTGRSRPRECRARRGPTYRGTRVRASGPRRGTGRRGASRA